MTAISIGVHQLKHCTDCGQKVAWATSKTSNKPFLANVTLQRAGGLQMQTHSPHGVTCKGPAPEPMTPIQAMQAMADDPTIDPVLRAKAQAALDQLNAKG